MLALWTLLACAGPNQHLRQEGKDFDLLSRSATLYWEAERWGDAERAAAFVEDPNDRALFKDELMERAAGHKLVTAEVLSVRMNPEEPDAAANRRRTATVIVRTEGYEMPAQILQTAKLTQTWYRSDFGWWVSWEPQLTP
jgi:hypothetical protein